MLVASLIQPVAAQTLAPPRGPRNITFGPDGVVIADQSSKLAQVEPGIAVNPANPLNLVAGFFEIPSPNPGFTANSLPAAAIAPDGTIYAAWADFPQGSCLDAVNSTDQFFPWIAIHPDDLLSILWLDRRLDPNNANYDAFYTNSADGVSFLPNVRVSTATSIIGKTTFIGDYNGLAVTGGSVVPIWTDMRLPLPAVFSAVGTLAPQRRTTAGAARAGGGS